MNVGAVVTRIMKQFFRDKRSLALLVVAPIFVLSLIWLVLDGDEYEAKIAIENIPSQMEVAIQQELKKDLVSMSEKEAIEAFQEGEIDAFLTFENNQLRIFLEGSDPNANRVVLKTIQAASRSLDHSPMMEPTIEYFYGSEELKLFDQVGAALIGFFIFFFVFIIGGISFLRERTQGTLDKLLSTPIKRWEIVTGYLVGFGLFTIIQSLIIVAYSVYVLDVWMVGVFWHLLIVTFLLAITALTLATLLSAYAKNEFQMMQFIPIVIIPQVFFAGIFPLETMDKWMQILSKFMPLTYGADAMQQIMIKGKNLWDIWPNLVIIFAFALTFFILNVLALKKHRRL